MGGRKGGEKRGLANAVVHLLSRASLQHAKPSTTTMAPNGLEKQGRGAGTKHGGQRMNERELPGEGGEELPQSRSEVAHPPASFSPLSHSA